MEGHVYFLTHFDVEPDSFGVVAVLLIWKGKWP